jgi:hypothetical protein
MQSDMGYISSTGPAPGAVVPNNSARSMMVANRAMGRADAADDLFSGVYLEAPARISSCMPASGKSCPSGHQMTLHDGKPYCCA